MERDPLETILERVDYIKAYGITEIDLSGGESSVEPNWFKILEYCQNKFDRISCLSHGGKFSNKEFIKKSYDLGLREILFSLHGFTANVHDQIVKKKGAFDNLLQAIDNAHEIGIEVRLNTTVYWNNHNTIDTELIKQLNPTQINFIALNYWQDNADAPALDYETICYSVKQAIDKLKDSMEINARYFPFCYMDGYEQYVKNHYHHVYDLKDWNKAIYNEQLDTSIPYTHKEKVNQSIQEAERMRLFSYYKTSECTRCKYFFVCDGIEKELKDKVLPKPIEGIKIKCV